MLTMRNAADDVQMMYTPADDVQMMYPPVDDVPDDVPDYICHPPAKSPMKSHSRVVHILSACRPNIICMSSACHLHETSVPRLFQVK